MKFVVLPILVAVMLAVRITLLLRSRRSARTAPSKQMVSIYLEKIFGNAGLIALREVKVRTRGKIFLIGTLIMIVAVGAAIIIPVVNSSKPGVQKVGVVGSLSPELRKALLATSHTIHAPIRIVKESSINASDSDLRNGHIELAIVNSNHLYTDKKVQPGDSSMTALLARSVASVMTLQNAFQAAKITPAQAILLARSKPTPIESLTPSVTKGPERTAGIYGVILLFILLQQYSAWTLFGVTEEKSSRVVEVLLSTVRPVQLLAGKVTGIGIVALAQAGMIVAFAIVLAKIVGSHLLAGTAPLEIVSTLVWLLLGYFFYAWLYAAAGSLVDRQDQLQSVTFPLSIPLVLGYIVSLLVAESGSPTTLFNILAYLPPTAPFAMPIMVSLGRATWWEFSASILLNVIGIFLVANMATKVYQRAILRTGQRVRLRDLKR